jgi:hypothetical protein
MEGGQGVSQGQTLLVRAMRRRRCRARASDILREGIPGRWWIMRLVIVTGGRRPPWYYRRPRQPAGKST